jgi:hypothetical protein
MCSLKNTQPNTHTHIIYNRFLYFGISYNNYLDMTTAHIIKKNFNFQIVTITLIFATAHGRQF